MARRTFLAVDKVLLVGGRLCLDFVNTTGSRERKECRERLRSYDDVFIWSRRAGIVGESAANALRKRAASRPVLATRVLVQAIRFRECLYRVFRSSLERKAPASADIRLLSRMASIAREKQRFEPDQSMWRWRWHAPSGQLDDVLWPIAESAISLLTSDDMDRLRQCGECDWLFIDETKNKSRRWCKKTCGDRVKARRYYKRRRLALRRVLATQTLTNRTKSS